MPIDNLDGLFILIISIFRIHSIHFEIDFMLSLLSLLWFATMHDADAFMILMSIMILFISYNEGIKNIKHIIHLKIR